MTVIEDRTANTDAPILDVLAERWSTRLYDAESPLDEAALTSALEAARWTPSAYNAQPWSFVVARRGSQTHRKVVESMGEFNQNWASHAAALVVFIARTEIDGRPVRTALYDLGQAAPHFTVQAHADGLYTHQMSGFSADALAEKLDLDATQLPVTIMAVGDIANFSHAPEESVAKEQTPRVRRPISESVLIND